MKPALGLAVIGLGAALPAFDLAVNVAFPAITAAFALETRDIQWVVIGYVLTYAALMLAFGRLGDAIGYRRIFRAGLIVSAAAFVLCALAPDYAWLLGARVVQGVGAALLLSCAPALATSLYDESRRTWALGIYAAMAAAAGVLAPLAGGLSVAALGWEGVFWFRAPLAVLVLLLLPLLPQVPRAPHPERAPAPRALVRAADFVLPNLASVAAHLAAFAVPLLVPYYLSRIAGYGPLHSGMLLAASPIGIMLGSALAARAVLALGQRRTALAGGVVLALGQFGIALWPSTPAPVAVLCVLLAHGVGIGLFQVAYADIVIAALPRSARGIAGSLTMLTRTLGILVGVVALSAALHAAEAGHLAGGVLPRDAFLSAFKAVLLWSAAALSAFFALTSLRRGTWS